MDLLLCATFEQYCFYCSTPSRDRFLVPALYSETVKFPWEQFFSNIQVAGEIPSSFVAKWKELTWEERSRLILAATSSRDICDKRQSGRELITLAGGAAISGALLASYLGYGLKLVSGDLATEISKIWESNSANSVVLAVAEQVDDTLLFHYLRRFEHHLASGLPWDAIPELTLITGRDLTSLAWNVAKAITAESKQAECVPRRLAYFKANSNNIRTRELIIDGYGRPSIDEDEWCQTGDEQRLVSSVTEDATVIAYQTHGTDGCAKGGKGIVLCGLHVAPAAPESDSRGMLACGHGFSCPRGPYPIPLRSLNTRILLMASCNSLRLAGSVMTSQFNLGLSFLDGKGLGYVGAVLSSLGTDSSSECFLAALASGYSLAEATMFMNALSSCGEQDFPPYVAIGSPTLRVANRPVRPPIPVVWPAGSDCLEVDFGGERLVQLLLEDPYLVHLAATRNLAFDISSGVSGHGNEETCWFFCYVERAVEGHSVLRLVLFRFPEPLGLLRLRYVDRKQLTNDVSFRMNAIQRWLELCRTCEVTDSDSDAMADLIRSQMELRSAFAREATRLAYYGGAFRQVERQQRLVREFMLCVRDLLLLDLGDRLSGPFWLINQIGCEYRFEEASETVCPNCKRIAASKMLQHSSNHEIRNIIVCPRCLTVSDLRRGGDFAGIVISSPERVCRGRILRVEVTLHFGHCRSESLSMSVVLRLSTHGLCNIPPNPTVAERSVSHSGSTVFDFQMAVPHDLPPHHYFLKVLAATEADLAFASAVIFVT